MGVKVGLGRSLSSDQDLIDFSTVRHAQKTRIISSRCGRSGAVEREVDVSEAAWSCEGAGCRRRRLRATSGPRTGRPTTDVGGELQRWHRRSGRRGGHRGVRRQVSELQGLCDGIALEVHVSARWPLQAATRSVRRFVGASTKGGSPRGWGAAVPFRQGQQLLPAMGEIRALSFVDGMLFLGLISSPACRVRRPPDPLRPPMHPLVPSCCDIWRRILVQLCVQRRLHSLAGLAASRKGRGGWIT
jgi:hypothetical protein